MPSSKVRQFKKPFQPSIRNFYFSDSDTKSPPIILSPSGLLSPSLPSDIQSSLLHVGMRVRKSVPEGYKTGPTKSYTIFDDNLGHGPLSSIDAAFTSASATDLYDLPSSSQESNASTSTTSSSFAMAPPPVPPTRKRSNEEELDALDEEDVFANWVKRDCSKSTGPLRTMIQPKSRKPHKSQNLTGAAPAVKEIEMDDFHEADFLVSMDEL